MWEHYAKSWTGGWTTCEERSFSGTKGICYIVVPVFHWVANLPATGYCCSLWGGRSTGNGHWQAERAQIATCCSGGVVPSAELLAAAPAETLSDWWVREHHKYQALLTWWHVIRRAVHTKKPDIVWAVEVMRNMGSSGVTTVASGIQDELAPRGATVAGSPGAKPTGESLPNLSDRIMFRPRSWLIY